MWSGSVAWFKTLEVEITPYIGVEGPPNWCVLHASAMHHMSGFSRTSLTPEKWVLRYSWIRAFALHIFSFGIPLHFLLPPSHSTLHTSVRTSCHRSHIPLFASLSADFEPVVPNTIYMSALMISPAGIVCHSISVSNSSPRKKTTKNVKVQSRMHPVNVKKKEREKYSISSPG